MPIQPITNKSGTKSTLRPSETNLKLELNLENWDKLHAKTPLSHCSKPDEKIHYINRNK